jgi:hypothetical protein
MRANTIEAQHLVQCCGAGSNVTSSDFDRTVRLAGIKLPFFNQKIPYAKTGRMSRRKGLREATLSLVPVGHIYRVAPSWRAVWSKLLTLASSQAIANVVGHRFPASGLNGALKPYDRLINPIIVTPRIGFGPLTADSCLGYALVALIHHVSDHLGFNQASVTVLSIMCR